MKADDSDLSIGGATEKHKPAKKQCVTILSSNVRENANVIYTRKSSGSIPPAKNVSKMLTQNDSNSRLSVSKVGAPGHLKSLIDPNASRKYLDEEQAKA